MARQQHSERIKQLFEKSPVVRFSDVDRIIKNKRKTQYAKQLLTQLVNKGKIKRLTKGCYTKHNETGLLSLCYKPAYLGLQSALSFHGLWEQETIPVIITSEPVRQGIRKCMDTNTLIRKTMRKNMFGYDYYDDAGHYLPYSDIEKTLIDFFVFREKLSPEVIKEFQGRIDRKKLKQYLQRYPQRIRVKAMNALQR